MSAWTAEAECRDMSLGLFFPDGAVNVDAAKAVCARCPVREQCLEFAITTGQEHGVWGGMNVGERKERRKYRVIHCTHCGRRFHWKPEAKDEHMPAFCSDTCRGAAHKITRARSYARRKAEATG